MQRKPSLSHLKNLLCQALLICVFWNHQSGINTTATCRARLHVKFTNSLSGKAEFFTLENSKYFQITHDYFTVLRWRCSDEFCIRDRLVDSFTSLFTLKRCSRADEKKKQVFLLLVIFEKNFPSPRSTLLGRISP